VGGRLQAGMQRDSALDVYKPAEPLTDMVRHDFDNGNNQKKSFI